MFVLHSGTRQVKILKEYMSNYHQISQSILVIDNHVLFREGLTTLFDSTSDFHVVDKAGTINEGIAMAIRYRPDIVLMSFLLPDGSGLDATREILDDHPDCKIIFMTARENEENLMDAVGAGARGYLLKNVSSSSLLASLRAFSDDESAMSHRSALPGFSLEKN